MIVILFSITVNNFYSQIKNDNRVHQNILITKTISNVLNQLQTERDISAFFVTSKGEKLKNEMIAERKKTDNMLDFFIEELNSFNQKNFPLNGEIKLKEFEQQIKKISSYRENIDNLSISFTELLNFYSNLNKFLIDYTSKISLLSNNADLTNEITAYYNFLFLIEKSSIERAVGTDTFYYKGYREDSYLKFVDSITAQDNLLQAFFNYSSNNFHSKLDVDKLKSFNKLEDMRKTLINFERKIAHLLKIKDLLNDVVSKNYREYMFKISKKYKINTLNGVSNLEEIIKTYKLLGMSSDRELELINEIEKIPDDIKQRFIKAEDLFTTESTDFQKIDELSKLDYYELTKKITDLVDNFLDINAQYWYEEYSKKIDYLKISQDSLHETLLKKVNEEINYLSTKVILIITVLILSLVVIFYIAFKTNKLLQNAIDSIYLGMNKFIRYLNKEINELEYIDYDSKDELGNLARMMNKSIDKIGKDLEKDLLCVGEVALTLDKLERGFYSYRVKSVAANPQIRTLAKTINKMLDRQENVIAEILKVLNQYINYNYLNKIEIEKIDGDSKKMIDGINSLGKAITAMLIENKKNAIILEEGANSLLKNVDDLNIASTDAASRLEETAAAIDEITGNIKSSTENINSISVYANELSNSANVGENLASKTVVSMEEINNQVNAVNEAISIIDKIAFQTNILSLNAAVEAATAGEAGRGFAVVAQEVRNLASRSAEAAKEIKKIVETAKNKADEGKNIANDMISGYIKLNSDIQKSMQLIIDVQMSSKEQLMGIEQINDAVNNLDQQTQNNANIANMTHQIAQNTLEIAQEVVSSTNTKKFADS
jgi:methyl-accepting chemotaxis protein